MITGLLIFITGLILGWLLPQARAYYAITRHFMKCMDKRDAKIKEQARQIRILKLLLIKRGKDKSAPVNPGAPR